MALYMSTRSKTITTSNLDYMYMYYVLHRVITVYKAVHEHTHTHKNYVRTYLYNYVRTYYSLCIKNNLLQARYCPDILVPMGI